MFFDKFGLNHKMAWLKDNGGNTIKALAHNKGPLCLDRKSQCRTYTELAGEEKIICGGRCSRRDYQTGEGH